MDLEETEQKWRRSHGMLGGDSSKVGEGLSKEGNKVAVNTIEKDRILSSGGACEATQSSRRGGENSDKSRREDTKQIHRDKVRG